jgi:hypothetical protein
MEMPRPRRKCACRLCGSFSKAGRKCCCAYLANDKTPNQLWINQHDGTFKDRALISGTAYNGDGKALSGMGVTAADFENAGHEDIFVTNKMTAPGISKM